MRFACLPRAVAWGVFSAALFGCLTLAGSQGPAAPTWVYQPELLRPFWQGEIVEGETVLFIRDEHSPVARAQVLFPILGVLQASNSNGDMKYELGKDFDFEPGTREIVLPAGSRIASFTRGDLRRPSNSQKYDMASRDELGDIFFGSAQEYARMQTSFTYRHALNLWTASAPKFDPNALPRTVSKLVSREPLSIVVIGDSISAGANASGLSGEAPFQPAFSELIRLQLQKKFKGPVSLVNPSRGGTDTRWVLRSIDKVVAPKPDLVIIGFGMNDATGRSAAEYQANIRKIMADIRHRRPDCEFILVASMVGNRNWKPLVPALFAQYRDRLRELAEPGVAVADLTSIWMAFLELKQDWDLSGNGVNHPNDFGHRVYAQVILALLDSNPAMPAVP